MFKDAEKERVSGELNAAAKIQMGILPKLGMQYDEREEYDLAASMTPAREVGGDFYDIFMTDLWEMQSSLMTLPCLLSDITGNRCLHTYIFTLNTACSTE